MIPINRENLGGFLIACGIGLGFWLLIWLAGCGKPDKPSQWEINSEGEPIEVPLPVKGGGVVPPEVPCKGYYPLPAKNIGADASPPQQPEMPVPGHVNGIDHPLTEPQPIYGGEVEPHGWITVTVIDGSGKRKHVRVCGKIDSEGNLESLDHPCNDPTPIAVNEGDGTGESTPPSKCLIYNGTKWVDCPDDPKMPTLSPPKCPNKLPALAVMIADPSFPDVWRGAYLCNAREIVPATSSTKWRYVDQKRYGYQEWGQK